jgi:hypothetical protein
LGQKAEGKLAKFNAKIPDIAWGPLVGGFLMLVVGLIGFAFGRPWLFPSLAPTAYLQAENPKMPVSRLYNSIVGHIIGLLAGFAAIALLNAWVAPNPLSTQILTMPRVYAAAIALALTMFVCLLLKASHPPAGATTLLVALGAFQTAEAALNLIIGVLIVSFAGEGFRLLRSKK